MTQIPGAPKGFSEYYQQYLQSLNPQSTGVSFPEFSRVPEQKMSGFQKAIDFISRPLYAATNIADKALDLPGAFEEAERLRSLGQSDEAASTTIKALGNFATSGFTGLFAQSKDNKNLWSDIIEKNKDVANRNNPNYVDTENNVNPALKGTVGFIGDVVLDPINLIPGALIAKGVLGVGKAAGAVGKAVKRTVVGEKAADDVPDVKTPEGMRQGVQDVVDESVRRPAQAADKLAETIVTESRMTPGLAATSAFRQIMDSKKFTKPRTGST